MNSDVPATSVETVSPPQDDWLPVSPRYKTELRINLCIVALVLMAPIIFIPELRGIPYGGWALSAAVLVFLVLMLVWIPRRVGYTQYLRRALDMHMQTGYWWHTTTSVAINRIQHLELTQGPVERLLRLHTLVLYTAGGSQSDLKLPGLDSAVANALKEQLLRQVAEEETDSNETLG